MDKLLILAVLFCPNNVFLNAEAVSSNSSLANATRAHYYLQPEQPEPSRPQGAWVTISATTTINANNGWSSSSVDYGWTTISPTQAGWPLSTTTDYSGWATATPSPPGWSPTPPPPTSGWTTPVLPPSPTVGWSAPTPQPAQIGWTTPPPTSGWRPPPINSGWSSAQDCVYLENNFIANILSSPTYYKQLRPPPYDNPTSVSVDVFIKNILFINDEDKLWKVQLTLRQQWNDARLAYSTQGCSQHKQITLTSADAIWTPDLFFPLEEEASFHSVPQKNVLVWIAPNGDVTYSTRLTLTMSCRGKKTPTELICPLIIGSYAYSSEKMRLQWLQPDPIQIDLTSIDLRNYFVGKVATSGNGDPTTYLGQFPGVVAKFTFNKKENQCRFG